MLEMDFLAPNIVHIGLEGGVVGHGSVITQGHIFAAVHAGGPGLFVQVSLFGWDNTALAGFLNGCGVAV